MYKSIINKVFIKTSSIFVSRLGSRASWPPRCSSPPSTWYCSPRPQLPGPWPWRRPLDQLCAQTGNLSAEITRTMFLFRSCYNRQSHLLQIKICVEAACNTFYNPANVGTSKSSIAKRGKIGSMINLLEESTYILLNSGHLFRTKSHARYLPTTSPPIPPITWARWDVTYILFKIDNH